MPLLPTRNAPTSLDELKELLKDDVKVKVAGVSTMEPVGCRSSCPGVDVDGILRGKFMSKEKFLSVVKSDGFGFCSVVFGWDSGWSVDDRE